MKIQSNAAPNELNSPFYKKNRQFCQDFEQFVSTKKGLVKGRFNAWSYSVYGKIQTNYQWDLKYKRAVYGGSHSWLTVFYPKEVLFNSIVWTCNDLQHDSANLIIRKKGFFDFLNPLFSKFSKHPKYVTSKGKPTQEIKEILEILQPFFDSSELYRIQLAQGKLIIELRSEAAHFDILDELLRV
jgi:hypothetical protein